MPGSIAELAGRSPSDEGWVGGGGRSRRRHWWRRALLVDARRPAPIVIPGFLPAAATERRQHCKYESMSRARRLTPRDAIILSSRIQYNDRALERDVQADVTTKMLAVCPRPTHTTSLEQQRSARARPIALFRRDGERSAALPESRSISPRHGERVLPRVGAPYEPTPSQSAVQVSPVPRRDEAHACGHHATARSVKAG